MNKLIVKPIPARNPAPIICRHDTASGSLQRLVWIPMAAAITIPTTLPIKRPKKTPKNTELLIVDASMPFRFIPALKKAKSGIIKK